MTQELCALLASVGLLFAVLMAQGALVPAVHGLRWGLGPRDDARPPSVAQGRFNRIVANSIEALAMFAPLVIIAHLAEVSTHVTRLGAALFVIGRFGFAIAYAAGVPVVRSLFWGVGLLGTLMIALDVVRFAP